MDFIISLFTVIMVNIILSGDNAVVIAMASRNLKEEQRKKAVFLGSFGAIFLRVVLTFVAVELMQIPYFQVIGGLMLLWIAINLLKEEEESSEIKGSNGLVNAIRTIIVADLVMSLDNVVAIAGVADGNITLITIGLLVSIPLIIFCSQILMKIMERFPIIVIIGSALLGYTAGEMILKDKAVGYTLSHSFFLADLIIPILTAILVVVIGKKIGYKPKHAQGRAS